MWILCSLSAMGAITRVTIGCTIAAAIILFSVMVSTGPHTTKSNPGAAAIEAARVAAYGTDGLGYPGGVVPTPASPDTDTNPMTFAYIEDTATNGGVECGMRVRRATFTPIFDEVLQVTNSLIVGDVVVEQGVGSNCTTDEYPSGLYRTTLTHMDTQGLFQRDPFAAYTCSTPFLDPTVFERVARDAAGNEIPVEVMIETLSGSWNVALGNHLATRLVIDVRLPTGAVFAPGPITVVAPTDEELLSFRCIPSNLQTTVYSHTIYSATADPVVGDACALRVRSASFATSTSSTMATHTATYPLSITHRMVELEVEQNADVSCPNTVGILPGTTTTRMSLVPGALAFPYREMRADTFATCTQNTSPLTLYNMLVRAPDNTPYAVEIIVSGWYLNRTFQDTDNVTSDVDVTITIREAIPNGLQSHVALPVSSPGYVYTRCNVAENPAVTLSSNIIDIVAPPGEATSTCAPRLYNMRLGAATTQPVQLSTTLAEDVVLVVHEQRVALIASVDQGFETSFPYTNCGNNDGVITTDTTTRLPSDITYFDASLPAVAAGMRAVCSLKMPTAFTSTIIPATPVYTTYMDALAFTWSTPQDVRLLQGDISATASTNGRLFEFTTPLTAPPPFASFNEALVNSADPSLPVMSCYQEPAVNRVSMWPDEYWAAQARCDATIASFKAITNTDMLRLDVGAPPVDTPMTVTQLLVRTLSTASQNLVPNLDLSGDCKPYGYVQRANGGGTSTTMLMNSRNRYENKAPSANLPSAGYKHVCVGSFGPTVLPAPPNEDYNGVTMDSMPVTVTMNEFRVEWTGLALQDVVYTANVTVDVPPVGANAYVPGFYSIVQNAAGEADAYDMRIDPITFNASCYTEPLPVALP
jgi:hypothetical protein